MTASSHAACQLVDRQAREEFEFTNLQLFDLVGPRQQRDADLRAGWAQVEPTVETKRIQASGRLDLRVAG
jgi:hypothetical protein